MRHAAYLHIYNKPPKFKTITRVSYYRLPREFNNLAGAKGTVLQTIYKGALAFLVVINDRPLKELARARIKKTQKYEPLHGEGHRFGSDQTHIGINYII
jgi:hypothetical protein